MTRTVLIAAAGVDWASFLQRRAAGLLPNLEALAARGGAGWLKGVPRGDPLAAWTSLATGQPPEIHQVYRREEAWSCGVRPTTQASWRSPAVWEWLAAAGITTAGVAWPAAGAGADAPGRHVDATAFEPSGRTAGEWALPRRCAPADIREAVAALRVHPADIGGEMLLPLVPDLARIDQGRDAELPKLAVAMARAAGVQAVATWLLAEARPDALFVRQPWLGEVRAQFGQARDGPFAEVMDGAWRFLDRLVGRMAEVAGPDVQLMLVSPGWRARPGLVLGAPLAAGASPMEGADLLDVAPTLLALHGLASDVLPGRPIAALATAAPTAEAVRPPSSSPVHANAALVGEAVAAGYAPPIPPDPMWHAQGLALLAHIVVPRSPALARDLAVAALERDADNVLALATAALAHIALDEAGPLPALADALERLVPDRGWRALAMGAHHVLDGRAGLAAPLLGAAEASEDPDIRLRIAATWLAANRPVDAERVFRRILAHDPENVSAEIGLAVVATARRDWRGAEAAARRAIRHDPGRVAAYLQLTAICAATGRRREAEGTATIARRLGCDQASIDVALAAV